MDTPSTVDRFAARVRAFINWCEGSHLGKDSDTMRREALRHLSEIYAAALRLPRVAFQPAPQPPRQTEAERHTLAANLSPLPFQYYWEISAPTELSETDQKPDCGDLFDDFLDIYADVASGLWLYEQQHCEAAVFAWCQMFRAHWGRHAVSAMHALHFDAAKTYDDAF